MQLKFLIVAVILIFVGSAIGRFFGPRDGARRARRTKPGLKRLRRRGRN